MLAFKHKQVKNSKLIDFPFPICLECKSLINLEKIYILSQKELIIKYSCLCKIKYKFKFQTYYNLLRYYSNLDFSTSRKYEGQLNRTSYKRIITISGCYCITCSEYLHEKIGIEDINKGHLVIKHSIKNYHERCNTHINEGVKYFCLKCNKGICLNCLINHSSHLVYTLTEYHDYINKTLVLPKFENIQIYANEIMNQGSCDDPNLRRELIQLVNLFKYPFIESIKQPNLTLIQSINKFSFPSDLFSFVNHFDNLTNNKEFILSNLKKIKRKGYRVEDFYLTKLNNKIIVIQQLYDKKKGFQTKNYIEKSICMFMIFDKYFQCEFKKKIELASYQCIHTLGNKFFLIKQSKIILLCEYRRQIKIIKKWTFDHLESKKINDSEILFSQFENKFKIINFKTLKENSFTLKLPDKYIISKIESIDNRLCLLSLNALYGKSLIILVNYRNKTIITTIVLHHLLDCFQVSKKYFFLPLQIANMGVIQCWSLTEMKMSCYFTFPNFRIQSMFMYEEKKIIIYSLGSHQYIIEIADNNKIICNSQKNNDIFFIDTVSIENNILLNFSYKKKVIAKIKY